MSKYNLVYRITNMITNEFYIGKHETDDLNDGYLGSGHLIKYHLRQYGRINLKKEILHQFEDVKLMYAKEAELIGESFKNPLCLNLTREKAKNKKPKTKKLVDKSYSELCDDNARNSIDFIKRYPRVGGILGTLEHWRLSHPHLTDYIDNHYIEPILV